ncbi:MAG: transglycosylase SLT domain-containing protein [Bacteroidales bacterium]|nr:transglycosylase SLT domain-containing protein [Bacteroidales bacterium]
MRKLSVIVAFVCLCAGVRAHVPDSLVFSPADSLRAAPMFSPERTDSLLTLWYNANNARVTEAPVMDLDTLRLVSQVSDDVMIDRLSRMNPYFSLPFNDIVRNYMISYSEKRGVAMKQAMGLSEYYFPIFEETFLRHEIPLELKYLAVVESMLKPTATSRAGAKGLWQFMYRTGSRYGLVMNSYVDERMDVEKSTEAAARYLKDLYNMLGDWSLAVSAYNCGAGNVNKAIRRAGGKRDFWSIYPYLPRETRGYMPAFVGMMYAFNYSGNYGLQSDQTGMPAQTDTFEVHRNLHFKQINEKVGIPLDELRCLNPKYYNDIIPGNSGTCTLIVPYNWTAAYMAVEPDSLYSHNAATYLSEQVIKDVEQGTYSTGAGTGAKTVYIVKSGDTLSHIARRYHTSVKQLMAWNHLHSDRLKIGQRISVY